MQRHTMTEVVHHSRSTALERSVKTLLVGVGLWGGGEGGGASMILYYVATILALSSAVVYRRYLLNPREEF